MWPLTVLVLVDLSTTLNTVDSIILLQRSEHAMGVKGTELQSFEPYLTEYNLFM